MAPAIQECSCPPTTQQEQQRCKSNRPLQPIFGLAAVTDHSSSSSSNTPATDENAEPASNLAKPTVPTLEQPLSN